MYNFLKTKMKQNIKLQNKQVIPQNLQDMITSRLTSVHSGLFILISTPTWPWMDSENICSFV